MRRLNSDFVVDGMVIVTFLGTAPFSLFSMLVSSRSLCLSWLVTEANGPGTYFGMAGCLVLVHLVSETLGLRLWDCWLTGRWSEFQVLIGR